MTSNWPSIALIAAWGVYIALMAAVMLKWSLGMPTLNLWEKPRDLLPIFLAIAPPIIFFAASRATGNRARIIFSVFSLLISVPLVIACILLVFIYQGPIA